MIGELVEERADIVPAMIPRVERLPYITFTTWITINSMVHCVQVSEDRMSPKTHAKLKFLDPIIGIIFLSYFTVLLTLLRLSDFESSFAKILQFYYGIFLEQPRKIPKSNIGRYICSLWITFSFMIGVFTKTELVGYLALSEKPKLPKSFSDLQNWMPTYNAVNLHSVSGAEVNYFKNSSNADLQKLGKRVNILFNEKDTAC